MVCEHCGAIVSENSVSCDQCGAMLPVKEMGKGVASIRQGREKEARRERKLGSLAPDLSDPYLPSLDEKDRQLRKSVKRSLRTEKHAQTYQPRKHMLNWAMVGAICLVLFVLSCVGAFVYLNMTDNGQLILARMGKDANAQALWTLGREYLDQGYIEKSIATYEKAYAQDPEIDGLYDRLMELAESYEAAARQDDAEALYTKLYTDLDEKRSDAYSNIVRMMTDQGRQTEKAEFLKLAYQNTQDISFKIQRDELVPKVPTTSLKAGTHLLSKKVSLASPEGYDVYYLVGEEGTLPEDGKLYEEPFVLDEGGWSVRAVCVSSDLVSDELNVRYVITLPIPSAPKASLAPGTYKQRQRIRLRNVGDDPDVTFYYTIDSSPPSVNSPIYTEEGILLPGGKKILVRAVSVNKYGKVSNEMSVELRIDIPYKSYYRMDDGFKDFTIMNTKMDAFIQKFGEPKKREEIDDKEVIRGKCEQLTYDWGIAKFYYVESGALLYYFDMKEGNITAPRKTQFGMSEKQITEKFRDVGQAENQDGSRNLYYDQYEGCYAKVYVLSEYHKRIDYIYEDKMSSAVITLSYYLTDDRVERIVNSYVIK